MSFSLQLQPQTVTVKNMTCEEHMAVRQTSFDRHLINFVFLDSTTLIIITIAIFIQLVIKI